MARIDVKGDIITNDYGWIYELFEWDCIYPKKVMDIIEASAPDEPLDVYINSGGGLVNAGQEIYSTLLSHKKRVNIHIEGLAASAASIIAMAGPSEISPVGMVMIHNVSGGAQGDYHAMEKSAEVLKQYNAALCAAYCAKTGKRQDHGDETRADGCKRIRNQAYTGRYRTRYGYKSKKRSEGQ